MFDTMQDLVSGCMFLLIDCHENSDPGLVWELFETDGHNMVWIVGHTGNQRNRVRQP